MVGLFGVVKVLKQLGATLFFFLFIHEYYLWYYVAKFFYLGEGRYLKGVRACWARAVGISIPSLYYATKVLLNCYYYRFA